MKPDYKNWMPKGMVASAGVGAVIAFIVFIVQHITRIFGEGKFGKFVKMTALILAIVLLPITIWMYLLYRTFSYDGKRQLSKEIIEGVSDYADIPNGGIGLDVGCGSGALTIACAKKNPNAKMIGVDRWGAEYASFSKNLCESNAAIEGVTNISFEKGDAINLPFTAETFDFVTSNYVYHNIPEKYTGYRKDILLETLCMLKKGGTFAIHDIMSYAKYGDMEEFAQLLRDMGYEKVELINTTNGMLMSKWESIWMGLSGSTLLVGRK